MASETLTWINGEVEKYYFSNKPISAVLQVCLEFAKGEGVEEKWLEDATQIVSQDLARFKIEFYACPADDLAFVTRGGFTELRKSIMVNDLFEAINKSKCIRTATPKKLHSLQSSKAERLHS